MKKPFYIKNKIGFYAGVAAYILWAFVFDFLFAAPYIGAIGLFFITVFTLGTTDLKDGKLTAFGLGIGLGLNLAIYLVSLIVLSVLEDGDWVTPMISILICIVLIGGPTVIVCYIVNKNDKDTRVRTPEEVTAALKRGSLLSYWGMDLIIGFFPIMLTFAITVDSMGLCVGGSVGIMVMGCILFSAGRIMIGMQTRYINFINRKRTAEEENVLAAMQDVEMSAGKANLANNISKTTSSDVDDLLAAGQSGKIVGGYFEVLKGYPRNTLKNHWIILCIIAVCIIMWGRYLIF